MRVGIDFWHFQKMVLSFIKPLQSFKVCKLNRINFKVVYYKLFLKNPLLASSLVYKFGPFYVIPRPDRFFSVIYKRLQNPQSHSRKAAN